MKLACQLAQLLGACAAQLPPARSIAYVMCSYCVKCLLMHIILFQEVESLEQKKQAIQNELQNLQARKEELEYILESHRVHSQCNLQNGRPISPPDVKPYVLSQFDGKTPQERVKTEVIMQNDHDFSLPPPAKRIMLSSTVPISKPSRPNSLNVAATAPLTKNNVQEIAGISITTPSTGIQFNFDSLMVGGTGLTPVSAPLVPSCSTQQRNIPVTSVDVSSPDNCGPPKLVSL